MSGPAENDHSSRLESGESLRQAVEQATIRFRVDPGDVPPGKAARRMYLTLAEFEVKLPELLARGFPRPDPTTGMFDLDAIEQWRAARHNATASEGTAEPKQPKLRDAQEVFTERRARHGT